MSALNTPTYMRLRDQFRKDIVAGVWALGSHVTLAELSKHYEVSTNPVREALLQLQGEGVISMRMNRGAVIPAVDADFINNLYRVRSALQMMLARDAARNASDDDVQALYALAHHFEAASSANDTIACVNTNRAFHKEIDNLGNNPLAMEILEGRTSLVDAYRQSIGYGKGRTELAHEQHMALLEAIRQRDPERAAQVSWEHTESARLDLLKTIK
jgi:DNA-binding GntR family transcriptional regulator